MFDPLDRTTGRGLLLLAGLLAPVGAFLLSQQAWLDAAVCLAVSVLAACYGMVQLDIAPQLRRVWLGIGVIAGGVAFLVALGSVLRTW